MQDGEGKLSLPLSQVLPVGKPSAMWVSSSGPASVALAGFNNLLGRYAPGAGLTRKLIWNGDGLLYQLQNLNDVYMQL